MRVLILGYGDVGRTAARILMSRGVETVVVDETFGELELTTEMEFIKADVTAEKFWENIDVENFNAAIVALPEDLHAIFCVLSLRRKKPDIKIYVRCNETENAEKMYAAGADYVIILPIVAAEMMLSEIFGESIKRKLSFENIEIVQLTVVEGSKAEGKTIGDLEKFGVIVLGVECNGETHTSPDFRIRGGCRIAVVGRKENLLKVEAEVGVKKE